MSAPLAAMPPPPTAATVLASLHAKRSGLALALAGARAEGNRAPVDAIDALCIPGALVELSALPGAGALTLGLILLAEARRRSLLAGRPGYLCVLDPSRTLHAPAVASLLEKRGVPLDKLLVLQPGSDRLLRTAVRAQKSGAFAGVLVDAGAEGDIGGSAFVTGARRLALAVEDGGFGVLLTSRRARRGLPLPVAARAQVDSVGDALAVSFLRHRFGPVPRLVVHGARGAWM